MTMLYHAHIPSPPLASFVECMWSLVDAPAHSTERIVPSGTLELVINLHEDEIRVYDPESGAVRRFSGAVVSGAYRRFFVIDTREHASIVGVHFRPGGAAPFLGVAPGELVDRHVDLEVLWRGAAVELRDRLCEASPAARFGVLERMLLRRLSRYRGGHPAVALALAQIERPDTSIGEIATSVHLSRRRLIEVFAAEVGVTPKRFARVLRFQRALALARDEGTPDWGRLGSQCGYFDQSHLIHDFRELTGMTPAPVMRASAHVKDHHVAVSDAEGQILPSETRRPSPH